MTAAKKKKRAWPRRKIPKRRKKTDAANAAQVVTTLLPATVDVLGIALEAGMRTLNHVALEQLANVDSQLAEQLIAILAKKRSP